MAVQFSPYKQALAVAKMVYDETGAEIFDYLCDVADNATIDWTDEYGRIDIGGVYNTIENAGYEFIDFYITSQKERRA